MYYKFVLDLVLIEIVSDQIIAENRWSLKDDVKEKVLQVRGNVSDEGG
jgi:hypothetical protein